MHDIISEPRNDRAYQICSKCIMDTSDPEISFDHDGVCNHCTESARRIETELFHDSAGQERFQRLLATIKKEGSKNNYDCVLGVSGGLDSSFLAYKCKELGLRPLAVHFDNGWNSELAVHNIEKILKTLEIDLHTHVVDWEEFRDIQLSFFRASVVNVELPSDHAIYGTLFKVAADRGIRYIISGSNIETESALPNAWTYDNRDFKHIKSLQKQFGTKRIKTFPHYSVADFAYYTLVRRLRIVKLLNYFPYNRADAEKTLKEKLGWVYYGGKHFESVFTRFFQGYYLPRKFGFDKRRVHLACLIYSGQLSRSEALKQIAENPYSPDLFREDKEFVKKKFNWTEADFEAVMNNSPKSHYDYPVTRVFGNDRLGLLKLAKRVTLAS